LRGKSIRTLYSELCKNLRTDRDAVWVQIPTLEGAVLIAKETGPGRAQTCEAVD